MHVCLSVCVCMVLKLRGRMREGRRIMFSMSIKKADECKPMHSVHRRIYRRYRLTINLRADKKQRCAGYLDSLYLYTVNKHTARRSDKDASGPDWRDRLNITHLLVPGGKLGSLFRLVTSLHTKPQLARVSQLKWLGLNLGLWVVAKVLHCNERFEEA